MDTFCSHNRNTLCWTQAVLYLLYIITVGHTFSCTFAGVRYMHFSLPKYKRGANDKKIYLYLRLSNSNTMNIKRDVSFYLNIGFINVLI